MDSFAPIDCQVRRLVYPGSMRLLPVIVKVSIPISNFTVVLRYLQSRATCDKIVNKVRVLFSFLRAARRIIVLFSSVQRFYRSDEVSGDVIVQPPRIAFQLFSRGRFHRCYRRMISCVVTASRPVHTARQDLSDFLAPFSAILLLSQSGSVLEGSTH